MTNSEQEREKCFLEESRDEQLFLFKFFLKANLLRRKRALERKQFYLKKYFLLCRGISP